MNQENQNKEADGVETIRVRQRRTTSGVRVKAQSTSARMADGLPLSLSAIKAARSSARLYMARLERKFRIRSLRYCAMYKMAFL